MQSQVIVDPYADALTGREGRDACQDLIKCYPRVIRSGDDPRIPSQDCALVSFNLFNEPKRTSGDKPILGFFKVRGCGSEDQVRHQAVKIIKEADSVHPVMVCRVGVWHPLTTDLEFVKEELSVHTEAEEEVFRTESRSKVQDELRRKKEELEARVKRQTDTSTDIGADNTSLEYYTIKRVGEVSVKGAIEELLVKLEEWKTVLANHHKEIVEIEKDHPEYDEQWIAKYNLKRKDGYLGPFIPREGQFKELDEYRATHRE